MTPASAGITTFKFGQDLVFEVYVQYKEYMCFVKCMEALRGMKLLHINSEGKAYTANIKVRNQYSFIAVQRLMSLIQADILNSLSELSPHFTLNSSLLCIVGQTGMHSEWFAWLAILIKNKNNYIFQFKNNKIERRCSGCCLKTVGVLHYHPPKTCGLYWSTTTALSENLKHLRLVMQDEQMQKRKCLFCLLFY